MSEEHEAASRMYWGLMPPHLPRQQPSTDPRLMTWWKVCVHLAYERKHEMNEHDLTS